MPDDPLIGRQLANFRLERLLGRGGMAEVYFGRDVKLQRPVAIKVIDTRYRGNPAYAKRFVNEARAVATWRHENIIQVYYADDEGGLYYFVMEHIDGQDLGQLLSAYAAEGELMPHADVLRIGRAVASALDYAHRQGVIHRDVKPANVIAARDGRVVLGDFGLALDLQQGSVGEVVGTPHYIAPEQARRSSDALPQSDLYSLGVLLYEMLTGAVPFDDPSPTSVLLQHLTQAPPPPRDINPELSAEVEAVLLKALSKSPAERYQTGQALMDELEQALRAGRPATAERAALPPRPAGVQPQTARRPISQMTVAEKVARQPPVVALPAGTLPERRPLPAPAPQTSATRPQPVPRRGNWGWLLALGGGFFLFAIIAVVLGGVLVLNRLAPGRGTATPPATTPTRAAATQAASAVPATIAAPTETPVPASPVGPATALSPTPVPPTETPAPPAPSPAATVKYPQGRRFMAYYDDNSFYLLNLSNTQTSISPIAFERLDANDVPLNRFDGWRWAQFYPTTKPGWCERIEILSSPGYLRPAQCNDRYLSTRTPTRDDAVIFWTAKEGTHQFRVLWNGEEVARCEIAAGVCEAFLP